jgi:catenin alpha
MAVDAIISVDDFLAVSEMHIADDIRACIAAITQRDADMLDRTAGAIRGRSLRVCDVVDNEMALHDGNDAYTERVRHATRVLRKDGMCVRASHSHLCAVLNTFAASAERTVVNVHNGEDVDVDTFIDTASCVHDAVRDIRHALLMNRDPNDIDSDEDYEGTYNLLYVDTTRTCVTEASSTAGGSQTGRRNKNGTSVPTTTAPQEDDRAIMRQLPEEAKQKIQEQIDVFKVAQTKFEREVAKWDETGNDIVVLAKYMCMIMMEMTDFTRGRGPLKSTMDVINAAKKVGTCHNV